MWNIWKACSLALVSSLIAAPAFAAHPAPAPKLSARALHEVFAQRSIAQQALLTATAKGGPFTLYVVRFDSKVSGGGYCGAGSEDYLVLARVVKQIARPVTSMRLQSCLDTQSLYITDGDDFAALVRHLQPDAARCAVSFEPLTEGKDPVRTTLFVDAAHAGLTDIAPAADAALDCKAVQ